MQGGVDNTWINVKDLQDKSMFTIFISAMYFAFISMTTIGYGDISAYTIYE